MSTSAFAPSLNCLSLLQRAAPSPFLGCSTRTPPRLSTALHSSFRVSIHASAEPPIVLSSDTAAVQPGVSYSEWNFRGFRSCYASAIADSTPPDAPSLVLVHGFGANCAHWRGSYATLAARGYRVFGIDLLGFGTGDMPMPFTKDSEGEPVRYRFEYWSEQLRQFCKLVVRSEEGAGASPMFFVANSIGSFFGFERFWFQANLVRSNRPLKPPILISYVPLETFVSSTNVLPAVR